MYASSDQNKDQNMDQDIYDVIPQLLHQGRPFLSNLPLYAEYCDLCKYNYSVFSHTYICSTCRYNYIYILGVQKLQWNLCVLGTNQKCPDHQSVLNFQVSVYDKISFGASTIVIATYM